MHRKFDDKISALLIKYLSTDDFKLKFEQAVEKYLTYAFGVSLESVTNWTKEPINSKLYHEVLNTVMLHQIMNR
jgi:hypothetical protein